MPLTLASKPWRANSLPLSKVIEPLSSGASPHFSPAFESVGILTVADR
jgi:hypothetical protein